MSYGNYKHILGVFSFHNFVFNCISIIKTTYWVPLVLSCQLSLLSPTSHFFFFFSTFLSFSPLLYLFFSKAKISYSPTTHTEKLIPVNHSCRKAHTHRYIDEKSREIIGVNLRSHAEKLHHALILLITAIVLVLLSSRSVEISIHNNGGFLLETIGNDSIWKLVLWSGSSVVGIGNSSVGNDSIWVLLFLDKLFIYLFFIIIILFFIFWWCMEFGKLWMEFLWLWCMDSLVKLWMEFLC